MRAYVSFPFFLSISVFRFYSSDTFVCNVSTLQRFTSFTLPRPFSLSLRGTFLSIPTLRYFVGIFFCPRFSYLFWNLLRLHTIFTAASFAHVSSCDSMSLSPRSLEVLLRYMSCSLSTWYILAPCSWIIRSNILLRVLQYCYDVKST